MSYFTASELVGVIGMAASLRRCQIELKSLAGSCDEVRRKRAGSNAIEYHASILPPETQAALEERRLNSLIESQVTTIDGAANDDLSAVAVVMQPKKEAHEVDLYRQCPALMEARLNELTASQREVADARMVLVQAVLKLQQEGLGREKALAKFIDVMKSGELSEEMMQMVFKANAKSGNGTKRLVCLASLRNWTLDYVRCSTPGERLAVLSPKVRKERRPEDIKWLPMFMSHYRQFSGLPMTEAYSKFAKAWAEQYRDEPSMLASCPSYENVRYQVAKLPEVVKAKGRMSGSDMRQLLPYVSRDWSVLPVNYCWIGDGHSMKMKVAHPIHGRPFTPELTLVIDGRTRFLVGWSLALSENVIAVADAIRHGIKHHGKPWLYYSDNGGGEKNKRLDADITGILPRMGIDHPTGIPGNPQGRGIIERLNSSLAMKISREFATYYGTGADETHTRDVLRKVEAASKAFLNNKVMTASHKKHLNMLPTWEMLISEIERQIEIYNEQHEHSELPKTSSGRHFTPGAYRRAVLAQEDTSLEYFSDFELRDMFMPQVERKVARGCIQFLGNIYFAHELTNEHNNKVIVQYDVHDAKAIIVRKLDGSFICNAVWNANKRDAFPVSAQYHLHQQRIKGMTKRAEDKIEAAQDEMRPVLTHGLDQEAIAHQFTKMKLVTPQGDYDDEDIEDDEALERALMALEQKRAVNEI